MDMEECIVGLVYHVVYKYTLPLLCMILRSKMALYEAGLLGAHHCLFGPYLTGFSVEAVSQRVKPRSPGIFGCDCRQLCVLLMTVMIAMLPLV